MERALYHYVLPGRLLETTIIGPQGNKKGEFDSQENSQIFMALQCVVVRGGGGVHLNVQLVYGIFPLQFQT